MSDSIFEVWFRLPKKKKNTNANLYKVQELTYQKKKTNTFFSSFLPAHNFIRIHRAHTNK